MELEKLLIVIKHDTARDRESLGLDDDHVGQSRGSIFSGVGASDGKQIKQLKAKIELLQDQLNMKLRSDVETATMQLKNATEVRMASKAVTECIQRANLCAFVVVGCVLGAGQN